MKPRQTPWPKGTTLRGRYEIKGLLGEGGMGAVYRAFDHLRQREIALKRLHEHLAPETTQQLLRELALQELIEHNGVVRTYDADAHTDDAGTQTTFFTMALIAGPSLESLLHTMGQAAQYPPFSYREIDQLLERLAAIFDAVHQQGILHGDVKPSHILFDATTPFAELVQQPLTPARCSAWLKAPMRLIDFGLARPLTWSVLPTGGAGTPTMMAPEQWQSDAPLTPAIDVYAIGLLLYRMLTGAPHIGGQLPPPSVWLRSHGHAMPPQPMRDALDAIVAKALAYMPQERYPDVRSLWNDVTKAIGPQTTQINAVDAQTTPPQQMETCVPFDARRWELADTPISTTQLASLARCEQLRHLCLERVGLTDNQLVYLAALDILETLQCTGNALTGKGLVHLRELPMLRMLSLSHNPIVSTQLVHLVQLQQLRWLSLWHCALHHADIAALSEMPQLRILQLSETGLDDEAIPTLSQLTQLTELALHRTKISPDGIAQLRQSLPQCRIIA